MENSIKYVLKPSLVDMTLVQIAVTMWNHKDVRDPLVESLKSEVNSIKTVFRNMEDRVIENLGHLKQPKVFQEKMKRSINFIGSEICKWVKLNCKMSLLKRSDIYFPAKFCFTPHGTMDRKKTAEIIVKDENFDAFQRYKWASIYCLRDEIWELWNVMSKDCQEMILNECSLNDEAEHLQEELLSECWDQSKYLRNMVCLWTLALKKEQLDYTLSFEYLFDMFRSSVVLKNKAATEYFLQGLKQNSCLEGSLVSAVKYFIETDKDPDFLLFLLSKMREETQQRVFKDIPHRIMSCFLRWPFQTFFLETLYKIWDSLSPERNHYKGLLRITMVISVDLFGEFWQKIPTELKRHIANDNCIIDFLTRKRDKKNTVLMLQELAAVGETELTNRVRRLCKLFLSANNWPSLKFLIRKCLLENSSQGEMLKFKEELENYILSTGFKEMLLAHKQEWEDIFTDSNCQEGSAK